MNKLLIVLPDNENLTKEQSNLIANLWSNKGFEGHKEVHISKKLDLTEGSKFVHDIEEECEKEGVDSLDVVFIEEQPRLMCLFSEAAGETRTKYYYDFTGKSKDFKISVYGNGNLETDKDSLWIPELLV